MTTRTTRTTRTTQAPLATLLVRLTDDVTEAEVGALLRALDLPTTPHANWRRHLRALLTARLPARPDADRLAALASLPGVERLRALAPGEHLVTALAGDGTVRLPNGAVIGGTSPVVIAGPCTVESEAQVCRLAAAVRDAGAGALRGGVFKPRTSPYNFAGMGLQGLDLLTLAGQQTGLPVVTEALDPSHLEPVTAQAQVIQIGSRNMHNFPFLLQAGSHPSGRPILLKRGFGATVDEFLLAAEHVLLGRFLAGRDGGLILCERGIRTFEQSTRFTLDVGAIPVLKERCHLPVIADPSHTAGARAYVAPMALAAIAAGADGLLVEVHDNPDTALCDGEQAVSPVEFARLMEQVVAVAEIVRS